MRKNKKILFIDTETGGIDPHRHQLLSIGSAVWENGRISKKMELLINDKNYKITEYALKINNINISSHVKEAYTSAEAYKIFSDYLYKNFEDAKVTVAGHNVMFDVNFLKRFLKNNKDDFYKRFSHRTIDTSAIINFLYTSGIIEDNIISSDKAFKHFKITIPKEKRHTALGDAIATAKLFNKLVKLVKAKH